MQSKHNHNQTQRATEKSRSAAHSTQSSAGERKSSGLGLEDNRPNRVGGASPIQRRSNNTGMPDQLKTGVESLSGHSMDDVKVHYNSSKPAQLNAHAYAQGNQIHLASGQEKHLPHEAWHVAQQKQGRVKANNTIQTKAKVAINDEVGLEKEADVMGEKAAKFEGGNAQLKSKNYALSNKQGTAAAVQRIIKFGEEKVTLSWEEAMEEIGMKRLAISLWDELHEDLGDNVNEAKLKLAWTRVVNNDTETFQLKGQFEALKKAILLRYNRSIGAMLNARHRGRESKEISDELVARNSGLNFKQSIRNPIVEHKHMAHVGPDKKRSREQKMATHTSTLLLSLLKDGQEVQASASRQRDALLISSNKNAINAEMARRLHTSSQIRALALATLEKLNVRGMSRKQAMADRTIRHICKTYIEIGRILGNNSPIIVPRSVKSKLDGMHAEIRIEKSPSFSKEKFFEPSGTRLPCWACYMYFMGKNILLGQWHGPIWITNAALTTQLEDLLDAKLRIGKFGPSRTREKAKLLARLHARLEKNRMAAGKTRKGHATTAHGPDSDSDLDETQFAHIQNQLADEKNENEFRSNPLGGNRTKRSRSNKSRRRKPAKKKKKPSFSFQFDRIGRVSNKEMISVAELIEAGVYRPTGKVWMVSGKNWQCYIRCVLAKLGSVGDFPTISGRVRRAGIDVSNGITVGSATEQRVQEIIQEVTGKQYHAQAVDVTHGHSAFSAVGGGTLVKLILTAIHFSLEN